MAMTSAEKMRRLREREAREKGVLRLEVNIANLAVTLVNDGFLHKDADADREQLADALSRLVDAITATARGFRPYVTGHKAEGADVGKSQHEPDTNLRSSRRGENAAINR